MKSFVVIASLCVVISYTTAQRADNTQHSFSTNFDRRFRNVEDNLSKLGNGQPNSYGDSQRSHVTQNGSPSRYNNGHSNVPNSGGNYGSYGTQNVAGSESPTYRGKLTNAVGDAGFDRHFREVEENLSIVADKLSNVANGQHDPYGDNQRSRVAQNSAPSHNVQASGGNYGSYGTQNIDGSESTTYRVDTNHNNCNVQAWNEQFERVEGRAGFSKSGPHPNPVVRCHQETVVRSKDFGNGVGIQSSTTTGAGSYRSTINRSIGDPGSEQLAKSFGAY